MLRVQINVDATFCPAPIGICYMTMLVMDTGHGLSSPTMQPLAISIMMPIEHLYWG